MNAPVREHGIRYEEIDLRPSPRGGKFFQGRRKFSRRLGGSERARIPQLYFQTELLEARPQRTILR